MEANFARSSTSPLDAPDILTLVLRNLDFHDLCRCGMVCRSWRQAADQHPSWAHMCDDQAARSSELPRRLGLGTGSTYSMTPAAVPSPPPAPSAEPQQPAAGGKARFRSFWTQRAQLGCLEPLLTPGFVRKRSSAAWARYTDKERAQGVLYPAAVKRLLCIDNIEEVVTAIYPTNNYLENSGCVWDAPPHMQVVGKHMMRILNENQGCCWWYVFFNAGQEDPPVYLCETHISAPKERRSDGGDGVVGGEDDRAGGANSVASGEGEEPDDFVLQNASFADFWVKYVSEGLAWYQENGTSYLDASVRKMLRELHPWMDVPDEEAEDEEEDGGDEG